jgi:hypothetical protein
MAPTRLRSLLAGAALGAFVLLLLLSTVLHPWVPEDPHAAGAVVGTHPFWATSHLLVLAALLAGAVGWLPLPGALATLPRGSSLGAAASGAGYVLGALLVGASMVVELTTVPALAPRAAAGEPGALAALDAAHGSAVVLFTAGLVLWTLGAALLAMALHAAEALPRWATVLGLVGMPLALLLSLAALALPDPARILLGLAAMLVFLGWMGVVATLLLRGAMPVAPSRLGGLGARPGRGPGAGPGVGPGAGPGEGLGGGPGRANP